MDGCSTDLGSPASQAELTVQTCSCPQAGQRMCDATCGKVRNTFGSVSIAVETERPVTGHVIITVLMGNTFGGYFSHLTAMELSDRDRLMTVLRPRLAPCG